MDDMIIGVNLPAHDPNPRHMAERLEQFVEDGYDLVEICLDTVPVITGGRIQRQYVSFMRELCNDYSLIYSAHISCDVDLRKDGAGMLHENTLLASIELCADLNMNPLVIHYGMLTEDAFLERRFWEKHVFAADYARQAGIDLCIENLDNERVEPVIEFIKAVNRPNFKMTLDTGHLLLTSNYFGFDLVEAVKLALPYIGHVHLNDNHGRFDPLTIEDSAKYDMIPAKTRYTFGSGDIHLPPFWGEVPFHEILPLLADYEGIYLCEYFSEYFTPFNRDIQERVRKEILKHRRKGRRIPGPGHDTLRPQSN